MSTFSLRIKLLVTARVVCCTVFNTAGCWNEGMLDVIGDGIIFHPFYKFRVQMFLQITKIYYLSLGTCRGVRMFLSYLKWETKMLKFISRVTNHFPINCTSFSMWLIFFNVSIFNFLNFIQNNFYHVWKEMSFCDENYCVHEYDYRQRFKMQIFLSMFVGGWSWAWGKNSGF